MVILGVDPGFVKCGYSILKKEGSRCQVIEAGFLKMSSADTLSSRIGKFYAFFSEKATQHAVTVVALETSFLYKNAQTFLKLGYLRGVLYLLADQRGLAIREFAPTEVKKMVTGFGGAEKEQVARALMCYFPALPLVKTLDITDAIAVSFCATFST